MKLFKRRVLKDPVDPDIEEDLDEDTEEEEEEVEDDEDDDEVDEEGDDDDEEDEVDEEGDDDEDDDEEEEEVQFAPQRSPAQRRPRFGQSRYVRVEDGAPEELSEEMAAAIRAGKYKPQREDPWSAHTLYNVLKDLGDL
jgi:hypothetical protein